MKSNNKNEDSLKSSLIDIFPMPPYEIQIELALSLYRILDRKVSKVILVESPTGTGKTYSLLVGVCKWLKDNPSDISSKTNNVNKGVLPSWIKNKSQKEGKNLLEDKKKEIESIVSIKQGIQKTKKEIYKQKNKKNHQDNDIFEDVQSDQQNYQFKRQANNNYYNQIAISLDQDQLPRIIFVSRTHSQLKQVINSIQDIHSKIDLLSLEMGSKNNLCINPLLKNSEKIQETIHQKCQYLLSHTGCSYYHKIKAHQFFGKNLQESHQLGENHKICPYYGLKNLMKVADIICIPYISILQQNIRTNLGINIKNSIIIFDQAHNVIDEELALQSPEINYVMICSLCSRIDEYLQKHGSKTKVKNLSIIKNLNDILRCLLSVLKTQYTKRQQQLNKQQKMQGYRKLTTIELLLQMGISELNVNKIRRYVQISNFDKKLAYFKTNNPYPVGNLHKCMQFLTRLMCPNKSAIILIKPNQDSIKKCQDLSQYSIKYLTLQSQTLQNIISMSKATIFAGGTLHPLDQYYPLLKSNKYEVLTYSHTIAKDQCQLYCVNTYQNQKILFNYVNIQKNFNYLFKVVTKVIEAAMAKINIKYGTAKAGIVLFVQNYSILQQLQETFQQSKQTQTFKLMIFDKKSDKNINIFETYQKKLQKEGRAILFSVMGGTLSEGINFANQLARIIIVFGLPFANVNSPELIQKMIYYDKQSTSHIKDGICDFQVCDVPLQSTLSGKIYYQNLCMRTINQTIGRGIRHSKDMADIFLVDWRFQYNKDQLSLWLRERFNVINKLQQL